MLTSPSPSSAISSHPMKGPNAVVFASCRFPASRTCLILRTGMYWPAQPLSLFARPRRPPARAFALLDVFRRLLGDETRRVRTAAECGFRGAVFLGLHDCAIPGR